MTERLRSLDAFRGLCIALMLLEGQTVLPHLKHSDWSGIRLIDLVYPGFLFASGLAFGLHNRVAPEDSQRSRQARLILIRFAKLFILGVMLTSLSHGSLLFGLGTLQCIAVSFAIAGCGWLYGGVRFAFGYTTAVYLFYWIVCVFIRAPGVAFEARWEEQHCFISYFDSILLGAPKSEEGLVPTLCAATYILAGIVFARYILVKSVSVRRVLLLLLGPLLIGAFLSSLPTYDVAFIPILSRGFSPTYCLVSFVLLAVSFMCFYLIIDKLRSARWSVALQVFGFNAITAYTVQRLLKRLILPRLMIQEHGKPLEFSSWLRLAIDASLGEGYGKLVVSCLLLMVTWGVCYILWRKRIAIKL